MRPRYFEITVSGRGKFPIDMLRYSRCWPVTPDDVANIERAGNPRLRTRNTVTVGLIGPFICAVHCVERFASFGWKGDIVREEKVA